MTHPFVERALELAREQIGSPVVDAHRLLLTEQANRALVARCGDLVPKVDHKTGKDIPLSPHDLEPRYVAALTDFGAWLKQHWHPGVPT